MQASHHNYDASTLRATNRLLDMTRLSLARSVEAKQDLISMTNRGYLNYKVDSPHPVRLLFRLLLLIRLTDLSVRRGNSVWYLRKSLCLSECGLGADSLHYSSTTISRRPKLPLRTERSVSPIRFAQETSLGELEERRSQEATQPKECGLPVGCYQ